MIGSSQNMGAPSIQKKQMVMQGKKIVVERFVKQYETLIKKTIRKNNEQVYRDLFKFLSPTTQYQPEARTKMGLTI